MPRPAGQRVRRSCPRCFVRTGRAAHASTFRPTGIPSSVTTPGGTSIRHVCGGLTSASPAIWISSMNFFTRLITWASNLRRRPPVTWPQEHFDSVIAELDRRGGRRHEAGVFLLGQQRGSTRLVTDAVYYDDLDGHAYDTGICVLRAASFSKLWEMCRERGLIVVADAHTHGGDAGQSGSDRTNPMVAQAGHLAIIVPNFAMSPIKPKTLGLYEYLGSHSWANHSGRTWKKCISFKGAAA